MAGKGSDRDMVLGGGHLVAIFFFLVVILGVVFSLGYLMGRNQFDSRLNPSVEAAIRRVDGLVGSPGKPGSSSERPAADYRDNGPANQPKDDVDFYRAGQSKAPERLEQPPKPLKTKPAAEPGVKPAVPRASVAAKPVAQPPDGQLVPVKATVPAAASAKQAQNGGAFRPGVPLNTPPIPPGATVLQVAALDHEADALAMAQALQQKGFPAFVLTPANDQFYRVQVGPYANAPAASAARLKLENQGFKSIIKR
jgi:cell division septation protein DedD